MPLDPFAEQDSSAGEALRLPPWEERGRYGLLNALYLTTREVLVAPGSFFQRMPTHLGLVQPLVYGAAMTFVSTFLLFLWSLMGGSLQRLFGADGLGEFVAAPVLYGVMWLLSPFSAVIQIIGLAAIYHLGLMLLGANKLGFEASFRVVAYARAVSIISLVPICGSVVGVAWELAVTVIGLARIHGVEPWRPLIAVFLPAILLGLACGALMAVVIPAQLLF